MTSEPSRCPKCGSRFLYRDQEDTPACLVCGHRTPSAWCLANPQPDPGKKMRRQHYIKDVGDQAA